MRPPAIHASLACWPGLPHEAAAAELAAAEPEPLFGPLSQAHVQLVPQSFGQLTEEVADRLRYFLPGTRFRLHANVRVLAQHRLADLSGFDLHQDWFHQAARISRQLQAPAYTAHPGRAGEASLALVIDNARRCADLFGCPVGIEAQYPGGGARLLISSWKEYGQLLDSDVPYAIDLSHVHILATQTGQRDDALLREMVSCERCIEVHVSDNDGEGDWHQVCTRDPWWLPLLDTLHPDAIVFSEGNRRRTRRLS